MVGTTASTYEQRKEQGQKEQKITGKAPERKEQRFQAIARNRKNKVFRAKHRNGKCLPGWSTISLVVSIIPIGKSLKWDASRRLVLHVQSKTNLKLKWEIYLSDSTSMYHLVDVHETSEQEDTALLNVGLLEHEPSCMRSWNTNSATNTASKTPA